MNPRTSSIRRLLNLFSVLASLTLVLGLLFLVLLEWRLLNAAQERELTSGCHLAQLVVQERLAGARLLAEQTSRQARPEQAAPEQATILVLSPEGELLASSSGRSLPRLQALAGLPAAPFEGIEVDDRGTPLAVAGATAGRRLVVAALPFSVHDAQAIAQATGLECSLFAGQARFATTLRTANGRPATMVPLAVSLEAMTVAAGKPVWVREQALPDENYLEMQVPLRGVDGAPVGAFSVAMPWTRYRLWIEQRLWLWLGVAAGGLALLAFLIARLRRRLQSSLRALQRDLTSLAGKQGLGGLQASYGLAEIDALLQPVGRLTASRAALEHNNKLLNERLVQIQSLAVLGQLAAGVAHDLNNPMATIMGLADIILASDSNPDTQRELAVIRRQAERSGNIVRNLLSFARRQPDELQWVSLNELLSQTLELVAYQARVGKIRCETNLAEDLPPIWADTSQMQQVFFNLIINALQAMTTAHGRGSLRVETSWVPPGPDLPQGRITIRVRDDGPGIGDDVLPYLFQPYFTTRSAGGGTGLGLSIASDIVSRHGGRIWAENLTHSGACFTVQLPVATEPATDSAAGPAQAPPGGPQRILLAEGDPKRRALLGRILRRQGYILYSVGDGLQARSRLELEPVDLVVCSLDLPSVDGRELFAWARMHRPELAGRFVFVIPGEITSEIEGFLQFARAWVALPPFQDGTIRSVVSQALR